MKTLKENCSKAEEVACLKSIAEALPTSSYLASLINSRLIAWFERQAHDDFSCDLLTDFTSTYARETRLKSENEKLTDAMIQEQARNQTLVNTLSGIRKDYHESQVQVNHLAGLLEESQVARQAAEEDLAAAKKDADARLDAAEADALAAELGLAH